MKRCFSGKNISKRLSAAVLLLAQLGTVAFALDLSTGPDGSNVRAVWDNGYTGQGVTVGLISQDHARLTHEAFSGIDSNNWFDATDQNNYVPSNHDTSVAGIICSRGGAVYPNHKGAAPDADLHSVKVTRLNDQSQYVSTIPWMDDGLSYLLDNGCDVVVTGIQLSGLSNDGSTDWALIYDYYAFEHNLVFATAAGNGQTSVTVFGDTYNSITTGGLLLNADNIYDQVGSTSNPGLTDDGRKKPDIVAPSQDQWSPLASGTTSWGNASPSSGGQTSWSVPQTGGVAAVLLSYANSPESPEADDNQNVVIKAVIVNSAFPNIVSKSGTTTTGQTWHTDRGYGRIDAFRAYDILSSPRIIPGGSTNNSKGWAYDTVSSGQQDSYSISGIKNERLLVTLAWNRRVEWIDEKTGFPRQYNDIIDPGELTPYLANLDLEIRDPDGILISPASSTVDNLEKVDLLLTKTGDYEIRVVNQSASESANYSIAFELLPPLEGDFNVDYVVNEQDLADLASYWLDADCLNSAQPCYDYNLSIDDSINLGDFSVFAIQWLQFDPRYYTP